MPVKYHLADDPARILIVAFKPLALQAFPQSEVCRILVFFEMLDPILTGYTKADVDVPQHLILTLAEVSITIVT
jgi:hypothetical protein